MKSRFNTFDLRCEISVLEKRLVGMRVNQIYDIDNKTYLIRLQKPEEKVVLLLESGSRFHTTSFEWPKNPAPSGFSMKLRKHINNKRLEFIKQMGVDRVIDLQFGSDDAAYHVILELYDRGNICLTDHEYKILNVLRPRVLGEDKFLVRETYPVDLVKQSHDEMSRERLEVILASAKPSDTLKKVLLSLFPYGPAVFEHLLLIEGMNANMKIGRDLRLEEHIPKLLSIFSECDTFVSSVDPKGYIVQKRDLRPKVDGGEEEFLTYLEFHPFLLRQIENKPYEEFDSFDTAVDEFFSKLESQKIELKTVQQEKQAMKKLENIKTDHSQRLEKLQQEQRKDTRKAELIEMNENLVDNALAVIRSAIANQIDWKEIRELVKEATENNDPVASRIKDLKLETNHFSMLLTDLYAHLDDSNGSDGDEESSSSMEMVVDIDIDLSARANARKYYHQKKWAAAKEKKTMDSHSGAMKSAEKKTKLALKEVAAIANINKARKVFWFEKFFWFISSENYLVLAGRDMQQNELLVKRYMRPGDVYVHGDLHGASSVIIKNPTNKPVPPKTLNEAGQMAICYSVAWENKVVASAWWVEASQVSKTAPSGEYLSAGSFMIRGKKNFLPPAHLVLGFGFMFKLEDGSIERHKGERKVRVQDDLISEADTEDTTNDFNDDDEIAIDENASSGEEEEKELSDEVESKLKLHDIKEEKVKEDVEKKEGEEEEEEGSAFPDTAINLNITKGGKVQVQTRGLSESQDEPEQVIIFVNKPRKAKQIQQEKKPQKNEAEVKEEEGKYNQNFYNKRGKKGKLKKIKEKYKDQDEEEKELRMQILQGAQKEKKKGDKKNNNKTENQPLEVSKKTKQNAPKQARPVKTQEDIDAYEEEKISNLNTEVDMLDSLTGIPVAEDELLFAVPVVAPYNTVTNFKFKVKLTPGIGKRGKATKTALNMFLTDRGTSQREKELFKSVKDQDLARNLPGKVKLSAPNFQKVKSKKK